ncbi:MAG: 6-phosphogluconolactonase [Caldilineae bacterium]|nr:MAG: 6-phosphogluconolactonase [Caldilineae bacterium]
MTSHILLRGPRRRVEVTPTSDDLVRVACELVTAAAILSVARRGAFRIALAGGSTPRPLYARLAQDPDIHWRDWHIFWSDERCVPPDHPDSNYRMAKEALLDRLSTPPGLVLRMPGELPPEDAARAYEATVRELVPANPRSGAGPLPRFDMILLGMGDDGHTASLFPHTPALHEQERLVTANYVPKLESHRLTFTYPLLNAARRVLVLVQGANKAQALHEALSGPHDPERLPIQGVAPVDGQVTWLVDQAAFALVEADAAPPQVGL